MSLRENIASANAALLKIEELVLPVSGETVHCRGMTYGEYTEALVQANDGGTIRLDRYNVATIAACTFEDPACTRRVWDADVPEQRAEIRALQPEEGEALTTLIAKLSGKEAPEDGEPGKDTLVVLSVPSDSSPITSPSTSTDPSAT